MNECQVRFLSMEHKLKWNKVDPKDAIWELHKLRLLFTRSQGEIGPQTRASHDLLIQVFLKFHL